MNAWIVEIILSDVKDNKNLLLFLEEILLPKSSKFYYFIEVAPIIFMVISVCKFL